MKGWPSNSQTFNLVQHKVAEVSQGWLQDDNFGLYLGNLGTIWQSHFSYSQYQYLIALTAVCKYIVMSKNVYFF